MSIEPAHHSFRAGLSSARTGDVLSHKTASVKKAAAKGLAGIDLHRSEARRGNQRGADRHRLNEEQAFVRSGRRKHPIELINVSAGGAMIAGKAQLRLWDEVELLLGDVGTINCVVRWKRGDRIGLEFADETRIHCTSKVRDQIVGEVIRRSFPQFVEAPAGEPEARLPATPDRRVDERRGNRSRFIWKAVIHYNYEWESVRIRDISHSGALVECAANLPADEVVFLDLEGLDRIAATVARSVGDQVGLAFLEPFDVSALAACTPQLGRAPGARGLLGERAGC